MSDDLNIKLQTTLEADEAKSAQQIEGQLPSIASKIKGKIKVVVEADSADTAKSLQQSLNSATASQKSRKLAVPVDVDFRISNKSDYLRRKLEQDFMRFQSQSRDLKIDTSAYENAFNTGAFRDAREELTILHKTLQAISAKDVSKLPSLSITNFNKNVQTAVATMDTLQSRVNALTTGDTGELTNQITKIRNDLLELSKIEPGGVTDASVERFNALKVGIDSVTNSIVVLKAEEKNLKLDIGAEKLQTDIERVRQRLLNMKTNWSAMFKDPEMTASWNRLWEIVNSGAVTSRVELTKLSSEVYLLGSQVEGAGLKSKTFFGQLADNVKKFVSWFAIGGFTASAVRGLRNMFSAVSDIDRAMTEIRKVTNETDASYSRFLKNASKRAIALGASVSDLVESTANFARLGYNLQDAASLGEIATLYYKVGDGLNSVEDASGHVVSAMKAFNVGASDAISIVDKFNRVGNEFAIQSGGIGEAMQRSASALAEANNDIDQSIALLVAANNVIQNPETVGNMWKTVSMRIRGATAELEEAGLETEGMAESTAKLQDLVKGLTGGFDIMLDDKTFKSTYDIVLGIGEVYDQLSDINQAALLEALAGKRQGNALAAALNNTKDLVAAYESSANAAGSAAAEHEKWLNSIGAKQEQLQAQFESLATSIVDSDLVKFGYDAGTGILGFFEKIVDTLKIIPTLAGAAAAALSFKNKGLFSKTDAGKFAWGWNVNRQNALGQVDTDSAALSSLWSQIEDGKVSKESVFAATMRDASAAAKELGKSASFTGDMIGDFTASQKAAIKSSTLFARAGKVVASTLKSIGTAALNMAIVAGVMWVVQKSVEAISNYVNKAEILSEKIDTLEDEYANLQSSIAELNSELETTGKRISELEAKPNLTFVEEKELEKLREVNRLLGIKIEAEEQAAAKNRRDAASTADELFSTWKRDKNLAEYNMAANSMPENLTKGRHPLSVIRSLEDISAKIESTSNVDEINKLEEEAERLKGYLNDQRIELLGMYEPIFALDEDERTTSQKKTMSETLDLIDTIQKTLEPEQWAKDMVDRVFSKKDLKPLQGRLEDMAKQGRLSLESIAHADFSPLLAEFEKVGLGAIDVVAHFNAAYQKIMDDAGGASSSTALSDRLKSELSNYSAALKILSEQESGILSSGSYDELIKLNANYASAIDTTTGSIRLNAEALHTLHEAEMAEIAQMGASGKRDKLKEYQDISDAIATNTALIERLTKVSEDDLDVYELTTEARKDYIDVLERENDNLLANRNQIKNEIGVYDRLASEIQYATSAYKKWLDAKNAPEDSDSYEGMQGVLESIKEGLETGKTGTNIFAAALETLVPKDIDPSNKKALRDYYKKLERYIQEDEDGLNNFIRDMHKSGATEKLADGTYRFVEGIDVEEIAKRLNITEEFARYMLVALRDYDWDVSISGLETTEVLDDLEAAQTKLADAQKRLDELKSQQTVSRTLDEEIAYQEKLTTATQENAQAQAELNEITKSSEPEKALSPMEQTIADLRAGVSELRQELELAAALELPSSFSVDITQEMAKIQGELDALEDAKALAAKCILTGDTETLVAELAKLHLDEDGNPITIETTVDLLISDEYSAALKIVMDNKSEVEQPSDIPVGIKKSDDYDSGFTSIQADKTALSIPTQVVATVDPRFAATVSQINSLKQSIFAIESLKNAGVITEDVYVEYTNKYEAQIIELGITLGGMSNLKPIQVDVGATDSTKETAATIAALKDYIAIVDGLFEDGVITADIHANLLGNAPEQLNLLNEKLDTLRTQDPIEVSVNVSTNIFGGDTALGSESWFKYAVAAAADDIESSKRHLDELLSGFFGISLDDLDLTDEMILDFRTLEAAIIRLNKVNLEPPGESLAQDAQVIDFYKSQLDDLITEKKNVDKVFSDGLISEDEHGNHIVNLNTSIDEVQSKLDTLSQEQVGDMGLSQPLDAAQELQTALNEINSTPLRDKTMTITTRQIGLGYGGTAYGKTYASGTRSAKGGMSVVAEPGYGPEAVLDPVSGKYAIYSQPAAIDLPPGAIVLNRKETERMLSQRPDISGSTFATGGGFLKKADKVAIEALLLGDKVSGGGGTILSSSTSSKKKTSSKSSGSSSSSSSFDDLFDWIEIRLDQLSKQTENLIDQSERLVEYKDRNDKLSAALASTADHLSQSQTAVTKYMAQADAVAKKTKLSADIIAKIQDGSLEISSYKKSVQESIQEYQRWYDKATDVKDAIEEIKDQQREIAATKLDNIVEQYDNLLDRIEGRAELAESMIDLKNALGERIYSTDYVNMTDAGAKSIETLTEAHKTLSVELANMVARGLIDEGSDAWHEYRGKIEDLDQSIVTAKTDLRELEDTVASITLNELKYSLAELEAVQESIESIMALRDTQQNDNTPDDYERLIDTAHDQIENIEAQNAALRTQMVGLDRLSKKYQDISDELAQNEQNILAIKRAQEEWNDSIYELQIAALEQQQEELQKTNDLYQRQLTLQQAIEDVEKAKQRRVRIYREGSGYGYEVDQTALRSAQDTLDQTRHDEMISTIDDAIDALRDMQTQDNLYDRYGLAQYSDGGKNTRPGPAMLHGTPSEPEWILNTDQMRELQKFIDKTDTLAQTIWGRQNASLIDATRLTGQHAIPSLAFNGDIHVHEVNNGDELARAIVTELPLGMQKEIYKRA